MRKYTCTRCFYVSLQLEHGFYYFSGYRKWERGKYSFFFVFVSSSWKRSPNYAIVWVRVCAITHLKPVDWNQIHADSTKAFWTYDRPQGFAIDLSYRTIHTGNLTFADIGSGDYAMHMIDHFHMNELKMLENVENW